MGRQGCWRISTRAGGSLKSSQAAGMRCRSLPAPPWMSRRCARACFTPRKLLRALPRSPHGCESFGEESFPVMQQPRMALHPWKGGFRWCWITYAYVPMDVEEPGGQPTGRTALDLAQVFVDARTGERFLVTPMRMSAEVADTGSGLASTPLGGPFTTRSLKIVRESGTNTYRLRDTTHARDIVTYDAAASASFSDCVRDRGWNPQRHPAKIRGHRRQQDVEHHCRDNAKRRPHGVAAARGGCALPRGRDL